MKLSWEHSHALSFLCHLSLLSTDGRVESEAPLTCKAKDILLSDLLEKKFVNLTKVSGKLHKRQTTVTAPGEGKSKGQSWKGDFLQFDVYSF